MSAHADHKHQQAIEHITELLEQLQEEKLEAEHSELDGCRDAIDKATAILLDQGKLGVSLGLDSAVHAINTALGRADRRLARWQIALDETHLELASLAIVPKRRVVLQAVEHAQSDPGNPFCSTAAAVLRRISTSFSSSVIRARTCAGAADSTVAVGAMRKVSLGA